MTTAEELIESAKNLIKEKKYDEVILRLTDNLLEKFHDPSLYVERARAHGFLNEFDEAIQLAKNALEIDPNHSQSYVVLGGVFRLKKDYSDAIQYLNKALEYNPNNAKAYYSIGLIYRDLKDFDSAIKEFNKAIALDPNYTDVYNSRGNVYCDIKDFERAFLDYKQALKLEPNYTYAYNGLGNAYSSLKDYDQALSNYNKSIELDPQYAQPFNGKGNVFRKLKRYSEALAAYNKAIEIDPEFVLAYVNKGNVLRLKKEYNLALSEFNKAIVLNPNSGNAFYGKGYTLYLQENFEEAIKNLEKVIQINPSHESALYYLSLAKLKVGKSLENEDANYYSDSSPSFLINILIEIDDNELKQKIISIGIAIIECIDKIKGFSFNSKNTSLTNAVAHYTKLKVADILLTSNESKLRYYNVIHMNDPEEGAILFDCLNDKKILSSFIAGKIEEDNNVYLGSFLPGSHEDDLVMWRTYGKDENNNEAAGCSLMLDVDFFDGENDFFSEDLRENLNIDSSNELVQSLYEVIYFDKRKKEFIGNNRINLNSQIKLLSRFLNDLLAVKDKRDKNSKRNIAIDKIIFRLLSELRYLFKSADYSYENELRVIQYVSPINEKVKIDDNGGILPKRLYIESTKHIQPYLKEITLGPKVNKPNQWAYLDILMKKKGYNNMRVKKSLCKFQ